MARTYPAVSTKLSDQLANSIKKDASTAPETSLINKGWGEAVAESGKFTLPGVPPTCGLGIQWELFLDVARGYLERVTPRTVGATGHFPLSP